MHLRHLPPLTLAVALAIALSSAYAQDKPSPQSPAIESGQDVPAPAQAREQQDADSDAAAGAGQPPQDEPVQEQPVEGGSGQGYPAEGGSPQAPELDPELELESADPAEEPAAEAVGRLNADSSESRLPLDEIRRYVAVYNAVKQAYVEPVDDKKLMQSAIRGLLLDLDPHSAYLEKSAAEDFDELARGAYEGIGVELFRQPDGALRVIAPIDDTPAARAGIKSGDLIVAIDGKPLRAGDDDSSAPLRGEAGSEVELTIVRDGRDKPLDIAVERQVINIASIRGRMLEPGYGYIRISAFQVDTASDFEARLDKLKTEAGGSLRGLVIDLRSNPGGLLTSAVQIADALLEDGEIVSTRGRIAINDARFSATPGDRLDGAPVVLLMDAGSASASEVLAGALHDNGRARVVGSRSFGKGSVQTVLPLDNGDSVKLTTARYYTPSGKSIQALGIVPDVVLEPAANDEEDSDDDRPGYSEASLPGHLAGDGDALPGDNAGDVLDGEAFIEQALAELKKQVKSPAAVPRESAPAKAQ